MEPIATYIILTRMASIDLHPTWVGVLAFQSRSLSDLGGLL